MEKNITVDLCSMNKMNICSKALAENMRKLETYTHNSQEIWESCPKAKLSRYLSIIRPFQSCAKCDKVISKLPLQCQIKARSGTPCYLSSRNSSVERKLSYVFMFGGSLSIILPCSNCPIGDKCKYDKITLELRNDEAVLEELSEEEISFLEEILRSIFNKTLKELIQYSGLESGEEYLETGDVNPVRLQETIHIDEERIMREMHNAPLGGRDEDNRSTGELARPYDSDVSNM